MNRRLREEKLLPHCASRVPSPRALDVALLHRRIFFPRHKGERLHKASLDFLARMLLATVRNSRVRLGDGHNVQLLRACDSAREASEASEQSASASSISRQELSLLACTRPAILGPWRKTAPRIVDGIRVLCNVRERSQYSSFHCSSPAPRSNT